ncbi:hypothetical protein [Gellertiella hungarica]|uniref:Uncharacterized protein n=1 Tax=Gellertiella hungarica TaxID=1572859 RepID=A0A7W6NK95_9HYPH|nr:hypothetical protein [Gellertiella hungarica]MBB4064072.1 hypothetical protein [Gellertiella hungarica]
MSDQLDLSDEGLVARFGDILHEEPQLFVAIRMREYKSRQIAPGGFRLSCPATRLQYRSTAATSD